MSKSSLKKLKKLSLQEIADNHDNDEETALRLEGFLEKLGIKKYKIYGIPDAMEKDYFEDFLIVTDRGSMVYDSHYRETLLVDDFKDCQMDLKGIHIDCDFELEYSETHTKLHIPKGSKIHYMWPEYMKFIVLSPDLKKGFTTISFGAEPSVDTVKPYLLELGVLESDIENVDVDPDSASSQKKFKKLYKKYDFVNSNM